MKRICIAVAFTAVLTLVSLPQPARAEPLSVIINTVVTKVLKAMDLAVQKLQTATIKLQNIQKAIENAMSKLQLNEIFEWTEKQRKLFDDYYTELWKVKSLITYYKRTQDIVAMQLQLVKEYKAAITLFTKDRNFTPQHLETMLEAYNGILTVSIDNVSRIANVISSFATQMSDAERLKIIDETEKAVSENLNDLRSITNQSVMFSLQKAKDETELQSIKNFYGIKD
jgi:hypothetical protein